MKRNLSIAAGVVFGSLILTPATHAESLQDTITKALQTNPQAQASMNRYRAEMEKIDEAWGAYLPSVDVSAGVGKQKKDQSGENATLANDGETFTRREASFSVKQNLFAGFNTKNSVEQSRHRASAEYLRMTNTLQDLSLKVVDAYLKVLERRDMIELAVENLKMHDVIYKQIQQRTQQGVARSSDLAQIEGRRARANANVINARNNLTDAESEFFALVGSMPGELEQPGSWKLELPKSIDTALEVAVKSNPNVMASNFEVKSSESQYESLKGSFYPTLDLEFDRNWKQDADGQIGKFLDTTAMLRLRYNIFRGGADKARLQEGAYRAEESRAQRDRVLRNIEESLRLAWAAYEFNGKQKEYLRLHQESSRESVEAYREQFNIGKRTLLDLLDSENELFQASRSLTSSIYQEAFARYRIFAATGQLMETLNVSAPEGAK